MKSQIPNGLTFSRGLLTIAIIIIFFADFAGKYAIILLLFFLASFTDLLDGYFARKWNVISEWGIVFDSLLDKILTISMFFLLLPENVFPGWLLLALVVRDLFIDGIKNFSLSKGNSIPSIRSGKWKFVFQVIMIHLALLALALPQIPYLREAALISGLIALVLSYYSGAIYCSAFFRSVK